jgi:putative ABC transport system permease protein
VRLTASDAHALQFATPAIGRTAPIRNLSGYSIRFGAEQVEVPVAAVGEAYLEINRFVQASGRGFSTADLVGRARVIVLGSGAARRIFDEEAPIGQTVLLNGWPFDIIGVLDWIVRPTVPDQFSFRDMQVYIPYTTAHEAFIQPEQADVIHVEIADAEAHAEAAAAVRAHLIHSRALTVAQQDWLIVRDPIERTEEMNKIMLALKALVGLVGSISLFVGAVGVMNIMIVSVTQRTFEIGLRRAVGARASWIRRQFLLESLVVTGVGGFAGLGAATVLTWLVQLYPRSDFPKPYVSWVTALVALAVIFLTGIAAGVTPAIRASRISPVEALRHE